MICYNKHTKYLMKGMRVMRFIILGKNIEVTEGLRGAVEDKIGKLAADIIGAIFKNLKGDESESLPRYYGNEPLRVSKTRKRFVKGL